MNLILTSSYCDNDELIGVASHIAKQTRNISVKIKQQNKAAVSNIFIGNEEIGTFLIEATPGVAYLHYVGTHYVICSYNYKDTDKIRKIYLLTSGADVPSVIKYGDCLSLYTEENKDKEDKPDWYEWQSPVLLEEVEKISKNADTGDVETTTETVERKIPYMFIGNGYAVPNMDRLIFYDFNDEKLFEIPFATKFEDFYLPQDTEVGRYGFFPSSYNSYYTWNIDVGSGRLGIFVYPRELNLYCVALNFEFTKEFNPYEIDESEEIKLLYKQHGYLYDPTKKIRLKIIQDRGEKEKDKDSKETTKIHNSSEIDIMLPYMYPFIYSPNVVCRTYTLLLSDPFNPMLFLFDRKYSGTLYRIKKDGTLSEIEIEEPLKEGDELVVPKGTEYLDIKYDEHGQVELDENNEPVLETKTTPYTIGMSVEQNYRYSLSGAHTDYVYIFEQMMNVKFYKNYMVSYNLMEYSKPEINVSKYSKYPTIDPNTKQPNQYLTKDDTSFNLVTKSVIKLLNDDKQYGSHWIYGEDSLVGNVYWGLT